MSKKFEKRGCGVVTSFAQGAQLCTVNFDDLTPYIEPTYNGHDLAIHECPVVVP
jgi:hypothetical protein